MLFNLHLVHYKVLEHFVSFEQIFARKQTFIKNLYALFILYTYIYIEREIELFLDKM